jgi:hypothetical protein
MFSSVQLCVTLVLLSTLSLPVKLRAAASVLRGQVYDERFHPRPVEAGNEVPKKLFIADFFDDTPNAYDRYAIKEKKAIVFDEDHFYDEWEKPQASITLKSYPAAIDDGGDIVISWSGVQNPQPQDFIALSCGPLQNEQDYLTKIDVTHHDAKLNSVRFSGL